MKAAEWGKEWQRDSLVGHSCFEVVHDVVGFVLVVLLHPLEVIPRVGPTIDAGIPAAPSQP